MADILDLSNMTVKQVTDIMTPTKPGSLVVKLKGNKLYQISKNNKIDEYEPMNLSELNQRQLTDLINPNKPGALMCKLKGGYLYKITKNIPEQVLDSKKKPVKVK